MDNFTYQNATKILFGKEMENKVGEETKRHAAKVLLHTGLGSVKRSGLFDRVGSGALATGFSTTTLPAVIC